MLIDISQPLGPGSAVFPGDSEFSREWVMRMADGMSCNVSTIRMSVHCGSHADAPLHYREGEASIDALPLDLFVGPCRVIHVTGAGDPRCVPAEVLDGAALGGATRVLLRTAETLDPMRFDPGFTSLGEAAARVLAKAGVRLIGIDAPSVDHATSKKLETHNALADAGITILENLDLTQVAAGDYELMALPLKLVGSDASPIRAVLRPLTKS